MNRTHTEFNIYNKETEKTFSQAFDELLTKVNGELASVLNGVNRPNSIIPEGNGKLGTIIRRVANYVHEHNQDKFPRMADAYKTIQELLEDFYEDNRDYLQSVLGEDGTYVNIAHNIRENKLFSSPEYKQLLNSYITRAQEEIGPERGPRIIELVVHTKNIQYAQNAIRRSNIIDEL